MLSRRKFVSAAACALTSGLVGAERPNSRGVPLSLEPLGFAMDALEPHLDAATLREHHDVHHAQCLLELQIALEQAHLPVANVTSLMPALYHLIELPNYGRSILRIGSQQQAAVPGAMVDLIRRQAGAHINHTLFWRSLAPAASGSSQPRGELHTLLRRDFGSLAGFRGAFTDAALGHSGPGWAWLVCRNDGTMIVSTTANEDNPLMVDHVPWHQQGKPLLCLDLWDHAYRRRYRDDRDSYVAAWWNVVNWTNVEQCLAVASTPIVADARR